jgi:hypothetical protein
MPSSNGEPTSITLHFWGQQEFAVVDRRDFAETGWDLEVVIEFTDEDLGENHSDVDVITFRDIAQVNIVVTVKYTADEEFVKEFTDDVALTLEGKVEGHIVDGKFEGKVDFKFQAEGGSFGSATFEDGLCTKSSFSVGMAAETAAPTDAANDDKPSGGDSWGEWKSMDASDW